MTQAEQFEAVAEFAEVLKGEMPVQGNIKKASKKAKKTSKKSSKHAAKKN